MAGEITAAAPAVATQTATPGVPGQSAIESAKSGTEIHDGGNKPATPVTPAAEFYDLKVNGQMRRFTREQMLQRAGLAEAANERFEKASQIEKANKTFEEQMKTDPAKAFVERGKALGMSREQIQRAFENWYNEEVIKPSTMNADQRRAMEAEQRAKDAEAKNKAFEDEKTQQLEQEKQAVEMESVQKDIIGALEASNLPKTRFTVARMAFYMKQNLARGFDAPMEMIVQQVKDERANLFQHEFGTRDIAELIAMNGGEDFIKKVRKYDLERIKKKLSGEAGTVSLMSQSRNDRADSKERKTMRDVDSYFNDLRRTKR